MKSFLIKTTADNKVLRTDFCINQSPNLKERVWGILVDCVFLSYKLIGSPFFSLLGARCRYEESCSSYARRVLREKGLVEGFSLVLLRVWSCR